VAQDYQDGIFAGTNDVIETITGKPPLTLEEFVSKFTVWWLNERRIFHG
jgi:NAD(P)H dehydrogenase (quinone)